MNQREGFREQNVQNSPEGERLSNFDMGGYHDEMRVKDLESLYRNNEDFQIFVDSLNGDEKILDIGTGLGSAIIRYLRSNDKTNNLISLDLDHRNLKAQSRNKYPGNNLVQGDARTLPFDDKSIDIISEYAVRIDNGRKNPKKMHAEIKRVLKPGGYLITDENPYDKDFKKIVDTDGIGNLLFRYSPIENQEN